MNLKCVAIDDESLALQLIESYSDRIPNLDLVKTFDDALTAIEYLGANPVDLLFLDINMPDISGIDLAKAMENRPMIIFTTAYKEFAFEGFQLEAVDYLLKPIDFETFARAFNKAIAYKRFISGAVLTQDDPVIYVHSEYRLVRVVLSEVEYIESMEDYIKIYVGASQPVITLMTLKKVLELLPKKQFVRIHRSYVVAVSKILYVQSKKAHLKNIILPIGESYIGQLGRK